MTSPVRRTGSRPSQKKVPLPRDTLATHVVKRGMHGNHSTREQAGAE